MKGGVSSSGPFSTRSLDASIDSLSVVHTSTRASTLEKDAHARRLLHSCPIAAMDKKERRIPAPYDPDRTRVDDYHSTAVATHARPVAGMAARHRKDPFACAAPYPDTLSVRMNTEWKSRDLRATVRRLAPPAIDRNCCSSSIPLLEPPLILFIWREFGYQPSFFHTSILGNQS